MRILFILFFSVIIIVAEARMYQWTEPGVETTQLSGKPPAWYRSAAGGSRVFVFDKGRLIDDTAVEVADDVRQRMRQQAFILAEEDRQKAREKIARTQELKQKYKKPETEKSGETARDALGEERLDVEFITDAMFPEENQSTEKDMDSIIDKNVDELRAMIEALGKAQTQSAKQALE